MMQTQRTILWAIFLMSLFFLFDNWQKYNGRPSLLGGAPTTQTAGNAPANAGAPGGTPTVPPAPATPGAPGATGMPGAAAPSAKGEIVTLQNDVMKVSIDTVGGVIERVELLEHPVDNDKASMAGGFVMLDEAGDHRYVAQMGLTGIAGAPTHETAMQLVGQSAAAGATPAQVVLAAVENGVRIERRYTLASGSYELGIDNKVTNEGQAPIAPTLYAQLMRNGSTPAGDSSMSSSYLGPVLYSHDGKFQKPDFGSLEKGKAEYQKKATDGWIGIMQHYFAAIWLPKEGVARENYMMRIAPELYTVGQMQTYPTIAPGQSASIDMELFAGPKVNSILEKSAPNLELVRDYGFFTILARPMFWLLEFLHGIVGNWGWAIVLLTIIVKLAFFPLQAASYRSMAKMRQVTPKMQALRERYGDDRVKLNQAMMELYKTEKINPLGGCLPIVVQIPVFFALYSALLASVEMRGAPWIGWIHDLSARDPYFILPLLMAATMFIQTKLNPAPPDPMQAKIMTWMPLVFSIMFFTFPAGLVLYWFVSNLFSIAQQWVITRHIEGKPVFGPFTPKASGDKASGSK